MKYAAFLRGINVGGNKLIKMEDLRKAFETYGLNNVKTLLASGNVIFETEKKKSVKLAEEISAHIKKKIGHEIGIQLRTMDEILNIIESNPFKRIKVTPETRLYVTFLPEDIKSKMKIPYSTPEKDFKMIKATSGELFSVINLSPNRNSVDLMNIIEKEFGKKVTTRNWNTIVKIAAL